MSNALNAPVEAAWREFDEAENAAAAVPARIRLGDLAPEMIRLEAVIPEAGPVKRRYGRFWVSGWV